MVDARARTSVKWEDSAETRERKESEKIEKIRACNEIRTGIN